MRRKQPLFLSSFSRHGQLSAGEPCSRPAMHWSMAMEPEGFHVGILGYMGTYFFLLSSYYGAINRLADGGEARYRGYRLAAASGPHSGAGAACPLGADSGGRGLPYLCPLPCLPIALTLYFSIKHLILPDVDLGIIRVMRPYNACVIVFCMVQVLYRPLHVPVWISGRPGLSCRRCL